jgi:hypothetical protein
MSLRKLRLAGRDLLDILGTPDCGALCMDCRDHPARIQIMRHTKRDGSTYLIRSHVFLHLCETCAMQLVEMVVGMLRHMTHNRVDDELSHTTAQHAKIRRDTGAATKHDRRVRARIKRLKRDEGARRA